MDAHRNHESGNVLFLILIATALFAALSFAVTSVSRNEAGTGGGEESALLNSSSLIQYAASLRGATMQMIINGIDAGDLEFNAPADLDNCSQPEACVFHTRGGAAVYQATLPAAMANGQQGQWYISGDFEVEFVGSSEAGSFGGNEIIAFLPGISQSVCERFNKRLGITTMPVFDDTALSTGLTMMDHTYVPPNSEIIIGPSSGALLVAGSADDLRGKSEGCFFENQAGQYVYYQVIVER